MGNRNRDDNEDATRQFLKMFGEGPFLTIGTQRREPSELEIAKARASAYEDHLKRMHEDPSNIAMVVQKKGDSRVIIIGGGNYVEVAMPKGELAKKIKRGVLVRVTQTAQILDVMGYAKQAGTSHRILRVVDDERIEVEAPGGNQVLFYAESFTPIVGRLAVVEGRGMMAIDQLESLSNADAGKANRFEFDGDTNVAWDDIGGLEEAKADFQEAIEGPFLHEAVFKRFKQKAIKGILLFGPPGCGKTMLAKAAATSIAKAHGLEKRPDGAFLYVKGPELLDKFIGESEANVRALFQSAREFKTKHGFPAIIFIDEADALLRRRGGGGQIHAMTEKTIVPQFLTEMDGMEESSALVVLATNRQEDLDPAIVREGRIDRKICVTRPTREVAQLIFARYLEGKPLEDTAEALAEYAAERLFSSKHVLMELVTMPVERKGTELILAPPTKPSENTHYFTLGHATSGAMIATIVELASGIAIKREIKQGIEQSVTRGDLAEAIRLQAKQTRAIDFTDDVQHFIDSVIKEKVTSFRKIDADLN